MSTPPLASSSNAAKKNDAKIAPTISSTPIVTTSNTPPKKKLGTLRVGTAGWTNKPAWRGPFFPPRTSVRDELDAYQHHLRAVEINGTCHRMPSDSAVLHWKEQCGKGFCMSPKMVKTVTHDGAPDRPQALADLRVFCDRVALLKEYLGPILIQFPRTLQLQASHVDAMADVITNSALASPQTRIAVEVRHPQALTDKALLNALRRHGWCLVQHPNSVGRSTIVAEQRTGDDAGTSSYNLQPLDASTWPLTAQSWMYVRLHGSNDAHHGSYTQEQLAQQAVPAMVEWLQQGVDVYAFILNDDETAAMPRNAQTLQTLCYAAMPGVSVPRAPKQAAVSISSFFTPRKTAKRDMAADPGNAGGNKRPKSANAKDSSASKRTAPRQSDEFWSNGVG